MFKKSSPQSSLLEPAFGLSAAKQARLAKTWAWHFREQCLARIPEADFASAYCADNGRPNASIRVQVGMLVLKDVFDLTDEETVDAATFDVRWQTALGLGDDDPVPCPRTLRNFRDRLAHDERVEQLFTQTTDVLLDFLGINTERQRLDSTQICSNIALLSRLSRFCETHRLLLHRLTRHAPAALAQIPASVQRRYVRADGSDSSYDDARSAEGRRRLAVCARDAWRLVDAVRGVDLPQSAAEAYALVERLLREQCLPLETPATPQADDADAAEPPVPVRLREKGEVAGGGLQTPHDPDATYGHKGVGYTVTLCETLGNGETPEMITHLTLTQAQASDQLQTVPTVAALQARGCAPRELLADASFGSTENLLACQESGTTLIAPVPGGMALPDHPVILVACLPGAPPTACSLGVPAERTDRTSEDPHAGYRVTFAAAACAGCPQGDRCPAVLQADGTRHFRATELEAVNTLRRYQETTPAFKEPYRMRSGVEGTNSECKRAHGLGRLRVRRWDRVRVAVYLKGLACNVKRALQHWVREAADQAKTTKQACAVLPWPVTGGPRAGVPARPYGPCAWVCLSATVRAA